ncbi:MAG TPA: hypothetical protein VNR20_01845 [Terriglobales bacterium]|nr:hypothetical protein [Terriglobales bacterium]
MRVRWALGLILTLGTSISGWSLPMKPDVEKQLEQQIEKKTYPAARVAWNGPETGRKPFNPVYEAMLYPMSGEAMRDRLLALAIPSPSFLFAIGALIYLLRLMRRERERANAGKVVATPMPAVPAQEAA